MKLSQGKVSLLRGAPALLAVAVLLSACPTGLAIDWDPHTAIEEVEITDPNVPDPNSPPVWLAGSDHELQSSTSTDEDRCRQDPEDPWTYEDDTVTHYWTATAGTFKDNDYIEYNENIGTGVTYVCANTAGTATINVYADDNYDHPDPSIKNTALADESPTHDDVTVTTVIPWVEEFDFSGTNNYAMKNDDDPPTEITDPEYDKSDSRNEPACQKMDSRVTLSGIKFDASDELTDSSAVVVDITGRLAFDGANDTWQTWDPNASGITMTSTDDPNTGYTRDSVGIYDDTFSLTWKYKVPTGSDTYITCAAVNPTTHTVYVVLDQPVQPQATPWEQVLDKACAWATDTDNSDDALEELVVGLNGSGLTYNSTRTYYWPDNVLNPTKMVFDLSGMLSDWNWADCQDCAMFLSCTSAAIGADLQATRRIQGRFTTKSIKPIGTAVWNTTAWNFHHIGWSSKVYDACETIDQANPRLAIDEDMTNPYKADLYSTGTWTPKNSFILGDQDPYRSLPTEIE